MTTAVADLPAPVPTRPLPGWARLLGLLALLGAAVLVHMTIESRYRRFEPTRGMLYVSSPTALKRMTLAFDAVAADIYWIRAVQHYGDTKRGTAEKKQYELLFPLLDLTTTLDPQFNIGYRFGAILLSEGYPAGPGRPDLAIALLEKGLRANPLKWQYLHDIGFVNYWWLEDYRTAADYFVRASKVPDAPNWLVPLAAAVLAETGDRATSRAMWTQIRDTAEHEWLKTSATTALLKLDAEEQIEELNKIIARYEAQTGGVLDGWGSLIRARYLRGIPLDPMGIPYVFEPTTGVIDVARHSPLFPLRRLK
jgi:tetratricopeptide (TPR) repeat protein